MNCLYRCRLLDGRHKCTLRSKECGVLRFHWCNGVIPAILFIIIGGILSYGIVYAWQGAEDRVEVIQQARSERLAHKIDRLLSEISAENDKRTLILTVLECESSFRHDNLWGDKGKSYGIAQIQERTFNWLSEKAGMRGEWMNAEDQVALLSWAIDNGYGNHWTCYGKLR